MSTTHDRLSAARRYLTALGESWKPDHDVAMECRGFEDRLGEAARVFDLMHELILRRRECVYRGVVEPNPKLDQEEKQLYMDWLALVEKELPRLESFESQFGEVENAEAFRASIEKARSFLARWTPAFTAKAPGSRAIEFSEEDAGEIHALLKSPAGSPGRPTRPPQSLPEGNPSILK